MNRIICSLGVVLVFSFVLAANASAEEDSERLRNESSVPIEKSTEEREKKDAELKKAVEQLIAVREYKQKIIEPRNAIDNAEKSRTTSAFISREQGKKTDIPWAKLRRLSLYLCAVIYAVGKAAPGACSAIAEAWREETAKQGELAESKMSREAEIWRRGDL